MQQGAKLISCESLQGQKLNFIVLNNQQLGSGAFGVVKKSYQQSREFQELAVKIVPYGDQKAKQKINQEVQMMRCLPIHPNLVKINPLKCFSAKNFYIFMEYCNEGTLQTKMKGKYKNRQNFSEEEIFQAFYQILSGYEVLWKKKILHQDLKPDNILIKNGVYKITDFGFSIFHEGVKFTRQRQGTYPYMPLQKLTVANYYASTKSDVYALGVIFYKMIVGRHPYVIKDVQKFQDYIIQLKSSEVNVPFHIRSKMSMPMQHLFDLILKMIAKKQSERIDFDEIYKFIQDQVVFLTFAQKKNMQEHLHSEQVEVPEKKRVNFVQLSVAIAIPFAIPFEQEEYYTKMLMNHQAQSEQKAKFQICHKIQQYLCAMRLMVYFFDRLNRRLIVQKIKKQENHESNEDYQLQQKTILGLLYLSAKITKLAIEQSRCARIFKIQEWNIYKKSDPYILKIIKADDEYLEVLRNQIILETKQSKIADRHKIIDKSKKPLLQFMREQVRIRLMELLTSRTSWIKIDDRKTLTTLNHIITAIDIIDNFETKYEQWEQIQGYFRKVEIQEINNLFSKVKAGLDNLKMQYSIDQGDSEEEQNENLLKY